MADYDAEYEKEGLVDYDGAKSKEAIKDWWSKTDEMDAISLAETIPDILERSINDDEGIIGGDNEAADVHELEVRYAS
jgi:hypothetical protein